MAISRGKGNGGEYFYSFCRGRQKKTCDLPYLGIDVVETAVDRHLGTIRLTDQFQQSVRRQLDTALLGEQGTLSQLRKRLATRLNELDTKESGLLDLLGDPDWPRDKIKTKLATIEQERTEIHAQLADTTTKLEAGRDFFKHALTLLADPQGFCRRGSNDVKRTVVKVIFEKLHVGAEAIHGHDLTSGIAGLVEADTRTRTSSDHNNESGSAPEGDEAAFSTATDADLLCLVLADHGSSRAALVEVPGIEPGSSVVLPGLLRAQFAVSLLGPIGHANKPM